MTSNRNALVGPAPSSEVTKLSWHDDERLQLYVSVGHDLVQRSPLGHQLECFRDNVRIQGMPSTHPPGDWGYGAGTAYARARDTAVRLWDTERLGGGSVAVLFAYCHPTAVALDGLPGGRGRLFAVCPFTELGQRARRFENGAGACQLASPRLLGPRTCECSGRDCACWSRPSLARRLYTESVEAKGALRQVWNEIYTQAEARLAEVVAAWGAAQGAEDERRLIRQERRRAASRSQVVTTASSDG
jgi:hypothetical protein